jgi:hypothetical protein
MSYTISNFGAEPPYGPTLELSDDMFANDEQAAQFAEGFAQLINDHTVSVGQDYRMTKVTQTGSNIWPVASPE